MSFFRFIQQALISKTSQMSILQNLSITVIFPLKCLIEINNFSSLNCIKAKDDYLWCFVYLIVVQR